MERPTCGTCPYLEPDGDDGGYCKRFPPRVVPDSIRVPADRRSDIGGAGNPLLLLIWPEQMLPVVDSVDWCGEHPDFPACLATRKVGSNGEINPQPQRHTRILELAEQIGYGVGTVRGWARRGYIPFDIFKNIYYFNVDEVRSILETRKSLGSFPKQLEQAKLRQE
jgi:hypothetical protein